MRILDLRHRVILPKRRRVFLLLSLLVLTLLLTLRIRYRLTVVVGASMLPTLATGDVLLIDRQAYWERSPERGDLVAAAPRQELIIKRVIGLPGEEVEVRDGLVFVDGIPLAGNHEVERSLLTIRSARLARGKYALLGDNRGFDGSKTEHAVVSEDQLLGKVVWSFHWWRSGPRPRSAAGLGRRGSAGKSLRSLGVDPEAWRGRSPAFRACVDGG